MATNFERSFQKASDLIYDFSCFSCEENNLNTEAEFYCEKCCNCFCGRCVGAHNQLFKNHVPVNRENMKEWPVAKTTEGETEQCQKHMGKILEAFCKDHNEMVCSVCHIYNHKKCSSVVLIADEVKTLHLKGHFNQLTANITELEREVIEKKNDLEKSMQCLQKSFKTNVEEIETFRKKVNADLDQLERNTVKELENLRATVKASIEKDIKTCNGLIQKLKRNTAYMNNIDNRSDTDNFITYKKGVDQSIQAKSTLQEMKNKHEVMYMFQPDSRIDEILSTLSGLGKIITHKQQPQTNQDLVTMQVKPKAIPDSRSTSHPEQISAANKSSLVYTSNQIIRVQKQKKYNARSESDTTTCDISGICETASGELLITDWKNKNVKLLDPTYKVVDHIDLPYQPVSMCSIDGNTVAIVVGIDQVDFIRATNSKLAKDRTLKFQHSCRCIAHCNGIMYISSGTALYLYTVDGTQHMAGRIYQDTVTSCAVSPDGDRIYLANMVSNQLVTLSRDGTVISKLSPQLDLRFKSGFQGLHVTDSGQVLVCGGRYHTILQVDKDGRQRLSEVVTERDGVRTPTSVYYSQRTKSLIVGMFDDNSILVFATQ